MLLRAGLGQQRVDHADDRRVVGGFQQVLDRRHFLHQFCQVEIGFVLVDDLGRIAARSSIGFGDRSFKLNSGHRFQPDASETAAHFGD